MPILSSQSGISAKALGLTSLSYSTVGGGYWVSRTYSASDAIGGTYEIFVDASNNTYIASYGTQPDSFALIIKYDSTGAIVWQKKLNASSSNENYRAVTVDSSGNVYCVGYNDTPTSGVLLVKYNSSGVLQWQKNIYNTYTGSYGDSISVDSSGNIYIAGTVYVSLSAGYDAFVMKLDSSANILWQRFLSIAGNAQQSIFGLRLDSSLNVYVVAYDASTSPSNGVIVKYNNSGTLQWQRKISGASGGITLQDLDIDSSGNIYVLGGYFKTPYVMVLIKYNSSGTLQWKNEVSYTENLNGLSCRLDSSSNIYCLSTVGGIGTGWATYKFDSSGNLIWSRQIIANGDGYGNAIAVNGSSYYAIGQSAYGGWLNMFLTNFPTDGGRTGTFSVGGVPVVYTGIPVTVISGTYSDAAGTLVDSAGNFYAPVAISLTDSAASYSYVVQN